MTCIAESHGNARDDFDTLAVFHTTHLADHLLALRQGEQGLHLFLQFAGQVFGIALFQFGRIGQQDCRQFTGRLVRENRPAKPAPDQQRQAATVIEMSV